MRRAQSSRSCSRFWRRWATSSGSSSPLSLLILLPSGLAAHCRWVAGYGRRQMEPPSSRTDFAAEYTAALAAHVESPGERGLQTAYELGRRALEAGLSMLELVGIHLPARRELVAARGIDGLGDVDAFL